MSQPKSDNAMRMTGWIFIALWLFHGLFSYLFFGTKGLAYADTDSPSGISYVQDLHSSGSNDSITIEVGVVFAIAAIGWGILRIKRAFRLIDLAVHGLLLSLQTLLVATIEIGSIVDTLVLDKNHVLMLWVISYSALSVFLAAASWEIWKQTSEMKRMRGNN